MIATQDCRFAEAVAFAARAHQHQKYGSGPYIFHPLRVAEAVRPEFQVVAVLHDCKEDAGVVPFWLFEYEKAAIDLLTRVPGEHYNDYIGRISRMPGHAGVIARVVKIADLRDNLAHNPRTELKARYEDALFMLTGA